MPRKKMKNWRIEFKPASSQIIEISTKGNKLPAEFCWLVPWFDKGWGGGCSRDFLWEPAGADKALQPAENKIINWLGFNGLHYLWVQTPRWEEIYTLPVISNLSSAARNNKPGQRSLVSGKKPFCLTADAGSQDWGWLINTRLLNLIVWDSQVLADFNRNELPAKLAFLTM